MFEPKDVSPKLGYPHGKTEQYILLAPSGWSGGGRWALWVKTRKV